MGSNKRWIVEDKPTYNGFGGFCLVREDDDERFLYLDDSEGSWWNKRFLYGDPLKDESVTVNYVLRRAPSSQHHRILTLTQSLMEKFDPSDPRHES